MYGFIWLASNRHAIWCRFVLPCYSWFVSNLVSKSSHREWNIGNKSFLCGKNSHPPTNFNSSPLSVIITSLTARWGGIDTNVWNMIRRQNTADNHNAKFFAYLPGDFPNPCPNRSFQFLKAIFDNPDNMISIMKNRVLSFILKLKLSVSRRRIWT